MVKIIIDNQECDLLEGFCPPKNIVTFNADDLADIERNAPEKNSL